jgi:filamentous hemagglutinin family protein
MRIYSSRLLACAVTGLLAQTLLPGASSVPTGGNFVAGSGSILASANALTINQSSARGVINWNNFSIGANGLVNFNNGSGATLNRVTGGNMTTILGQLLATGSVYILNPHGVLIGSSGTIKTTGDFVATPLQVSNGAFMKGGALLFAGNSNAIVKNLGAISSTGGSVFLLANAVDNEGSVAAANGSVGLAAGHTVLLKDSSSDQRVFVESQGGDITNSGSLTAAEPLPSGGAPVSWSARSSISLHPAASERATATAYLTNAETLAAWPAATSERIS